MSTLHIENSKTKKFRLLPKQIKFCKMYASSEEFFGNGVQSYIKAYNPKRVGNWYNTARVVACELLTKPNILTYINNLLELRGLNDSFVDKQLEFLITQHADFKSKLGSIHEYNQLKKRTEGEGNKTLVIMITGESATRYGQSKINSEPSTDSSGPAQV